jgi:hypothetical protein
MSLADDRKPLNCGNELDVLTCEEQIESRETLLTPVTPSTVKHALEKLENYTMTLLVSEEEHRRLNARGYRSSMPDGWDDIDPLGWIVCGGSSVGLVARGSGKLDGSGKRARAYLS